MTIKSKFDTPEMEKLLIQSGFTKNDLGVWKRTNRKEREDYAIFISDMPAVDDYVMFQVTPWDDKYIGISKAMYDEQEIINEIIELGV